MFPHPGKSAVDITSFLFSWDSKFQFHSHFAAYRYERTVWAVRSARVRMCYRDAIRSQPRKFIPVN